MPRQILRLALLLISLLTISCAGTSLFSGAGAAFDTGLSYFNRGDFDQASIHFLKATELDPEFGKAYLYLGRAYLNQGRWAEALHPLRTAYRLAPAETRSEITSLLFDALLSTAIGEAKNGNFAAAISNLREGLSLNPSSSIAQNELVTTFIAYGSSLLGQGKYSEAIAAYKEALGIAPRNFEAYLGLAKAFMSSGDVAKSREAARSAQGLNPEQGGALNELLQEFLSPVR